MTGSGAKGGGLLRGLYRWAWLWGPLLTLVVTGLPVALLHGVADDAAECFASIPSRTEATLPPCDAHADALLYLTALPFVGRPATRAHEEIVGRMAVWRYVDAAVGEPDRALLARYVEGLKPAADAIWDGSQRLRMDEVGPPMPVPDPGPLAFGVGDRQTLDVRASWWTEPATRDHAVRAMLLEGRVDRAVEMAERFEETPSGSLKIRLAALGCLVGQHEVALDELTGVEVDRAEHRDANIARQFGGVRVLVEACAHLGHVAPRPVPLYGSAGDWDQRERLAVLRLADVRSRFPACDLSDPLACRTDPRVSSVLDEAREILRSEQSREHRLALFAALADSVTSPTVAARFGAARMGEPQLSDRVPLFVEDWIEQRGDAPFVTAERYEEAALHVAEIDSAHELAELVSTLFVRAAVGHARLGSLADADRNLTRAALDEPTTAMLRAQAALVTGDRKEALRRATLEAASQPSLLLLQAELALPDRDRARALAKDALTRAEDDRVVERLRWLLLGLGVPTRGRGFVETVAPPPRYRFVAWPVAPVDAAARSADLDDALASWQARLTSANRRASRYEAFATRGDAPPGLAAWMFVGGQLGSASFDDEKTEVWLDAFMALDAPRYSLVVVALSRWRAAAWRGDHAASSLWRARFRQLLMLSQGPDVADLWQAVLL